MLMGLWDYYCENVILLEPNRSLMSSVSTHLSFKSEILNMLQKCSLLEGLARGLSGKILTRQGLEFDLQTHVNSRTKMKTQVWLCMLVTPALGRQKQEDPWCSLAS